MKNYSKNILEEKINNISAVTLVDKLGTELMINVKAMFVECVNGVTIFYHVVLVIFVV